MNQLEWLKRVLISPLLEECPKHTEEREWLSSIFSVKSREICVYRANKEFQIPGVVLEGGVHPIEGAVVSRKVMRSETLVARKDFSQSFYDVEHDGRVFRLSAKQWAGIEGVIKKTRGQDEIGSA
jgi:hypothetical protein